MSNRGYEIPDGFVNGCPEVRVETGICERYGLPVVDYDALDELIHDDFNVPVGINPLIKFRELSSLDPSKIIRGQYSSFTSTISVDPRTTVFYHIENPNSETGILLHEASHFADHKLKPAGYYGNMSVGLMGLLIPPVGAFVGARMAFDIDDEIISLGVSSLAGLGGIKIATKILDFKYRHLDNGEKRARAKQNNPALLAKYAGTVIFQRRFLISGTNN